MKAIVLRAGELASVLVLACLDYAKVLRSLYSVPTRYVGSTVRVHAGTASVRIYADTQLVNVHARRAGQALHRPERLAREQGRRGAERDLASLVASARKRVVHVGIHAERLLDVPLPWTRMRFVCALLRPCKKLSHDRAEAVRQSALAFDVVDVQRVACML
ncbi:hypothetical protein WME91_04510 [Sorangium sp. So ce269]